MKTPNPKLQTPNKRKGFTLFELLVVMAIIGISLGLGVAILSETDKGPTFEASIDQVYSMIKLASLSSKNDRSPAWVLYRAKEKSFAVMRKRDVAEWHLEDLELKGTDGIGTATPDVDVVPGHRGMGVHLTSKSVIDLGSLPVFDPAQGVMIDVWIYSEASNPNRTILSKGRDLSLGTNALEELTAQIGKIQLTTAGMKLPKRRWVSVKLWYAMSEAKLFVFDTLAASAREETGWINDQKLQLGAKNRNSFQGTVDELEVSLLISNESASLSPRIRVTLQGIKPDPDGRAMIVFDPYGRLDPKIHNAKVSMTFEHEKDKRVIEITPQGVITITR